MRGRYELGRDLYDNLQIDEAATVLARAEESGTKLYIDAMDPRLFSDLQLAVGLTRLEIGQPELAHVA